MFSSLASAYDMTQYNSMNITLVLHYNTFRYIFCHLESKKLCLSHRLNDARKYFQAPEAFHTCFCVVSILSATLLLCVNSAVKNIHSHIFGVIPMGHLEQTIYIWSPFLKTEILLVRRKPNHVDWSQSQRMLSVYNY